MKDQFTVPYSFPLLLDDCREQEIETEKGIRENLKWTISCNCLGELKADNITWKALKIQYSILKALMKEKCCLNALF